MGTDAFFCAEVKRGGKWVLNDDEVFTVPEAPIARKCPYPFIRLGRSYGLFGFLGGARNDSKTIVLAQSRGLPKNASEDAIDFLNGEYGGRHGFSWVALSELLDFDYDQQFVDEDNDPPFLTSYREFLGETYFEELVALRQLGAPEQVRVLFCFDS